jgi:hypothetical protein
MGSLASTVLPSVGGPARAARIDRVRWPIGLCFESHGVQVRVRSNHPALSEHLLRLLPPGAGPAAGTSDDALFSLWVPVGGHPRPTRLYAGSERRACTRDLPQALAVLESELRLAVATHARGRTFVHAGVVGWRGRAILLPGRSRSGKTTLVAELVRAGAEYLSDEFAVLDAGGRVHPFAKRLSFRGDGGCDRHAWQAAVEEIGGRAAQGPLPVGLVAVTGYEPGAAWSPAPLTPGQAVLELLAHTVPARLRPGASLEALGQTVVGATLLKGPRGEAGETARRLLEHAERSGRHEEGTA